MVPVRTTCREPSSPDVRGPLIILNEEVHNPYYLEEVEESNIESPESRLASVIGYTKSVQGTQIGSTDWTHPDLPRMPSQTDDGREA